MEADNRKCGVGVAFEASIGGIKMLDGIVNDRIEAEALGYRVDLVDIYTASWGPPDDGKSLDTPGRLASEALERGIREVLYYCSYFQSNLRCISPNRMMKIKREQCNFVNCKYQPEHFIHEGIKKNYEYNARLSTFFMERIKSMIPL